MSKEENVAELSELQRLGLAIRNARRKKLNPIPKVAEALRLTIEEWRALERGHLKVSYSLVTRICSLLEIPLERVFGGRADDFLPFVRFAMGTDPADLTPDDGDEIFALYLDIQEFRRERSRKLGRSQAPRKAAEG